MTTLIEKPTAPPAAAFPVAEAPPLRRHAQDHSVSVFFDGFPESEGRLVFGATVATRTFMEAMLRHGHMDRYEMIASPSQDENARGEIEAFRAQGEVAARTINVRTVHQMLRSFEECRPSVMHEPGALFQRLFQLRSLAARTMCPITFTHHTLSYPEQLHRFFLQLLLADTYPCDSVICTSTAARTAFERLMGHVADQFNAQYGSRLAYRGRYDVIPLGVDTDLFRPRDKADLRHQLNLPKDALIILWFGRFSVTDKMDLLPLVRTYAQLVEANPKRKLLFVLAGSERDNYGGIVQDHARQLGIGQHVRVLRNFPPASRHLLHAAADIFVSPSDNVQETFGITPIEAMACGVPQVVADWDGYRDTVREGETGFRVPTHWTRCDADLRGAAILVLWELDHVRLAQSVVVDPAAYRDRLQRLIDSEELREEMGRRSRQRAVALYSWRTVIGQYEALWQEVAEMAEGRPYQPPIATPYWHQPYFEAFGHYATDVLPESMPLRLTPEGTRIVRGKARFPKFPMLSQFLDEELLLKMLVALRVAGRLNQGYSLGPLVEDLARDSPRHPDDIRRHVMWLLKYDLAEPVHGYGDPLTV